MLNLKKGLALVLAAATAFTFAPVANLGPVNALAGDILEQDDTSISLIAGESKTFNVKELSKIKGSIDNAIIHAEIGDDQYATISTNAQPKADNSDVSGSVANVKSTDIIPKGSGSSNTDAKITVTAKPGVSGDTTLRLTIKNVNGDTISHQDIAVHVNAAVDYLSFGTLKDFEKVNTTGVESTDFKYDGGANQQTVAVTLKNETDKTTTYNWSTEVSSSDKNVATVDVAGQTQPTAADIYKPGNLTISAKGPGQTTVTVNVFKKPATGSKILVATGTLTVKVVDKTDELSVSYDYNRDGVADKDSVGVKYNAVYDDYGSSDATYVSGANTYYYRTKDGVVTDSKSVALTGTDKVQGLTKTLTNSIYLDTVTNKTAQITATDHLGKNIHFSASSKYFSVNNSGLITVSDKNESWSGDRNWSDYVTVSVDKTVDGSVNPNTIAGLTIRIPVSVSDKDTVSLKVSKPNGKVIAQTVGSANKNRGLSVSDYPVVYLSTKDLKTLPLTINAGSGLDYVQGAVSAISNSQILYDTTSDVVSYNQATQTLTALKAGQALVEITARNNTSTYGNATVRFVVDVVTKNANNTITAPADIYLTKGNATAEIGAKATDSATTLKYEIVKDADDTADTTSSSDVTVDAASGKVTYTSGNQGTVIVRVSGNETTSSLKPDNAYVTVHYTSALAENTLKVTSDKKVSLQVGETSQIVASGTSITYSSSDDSVATVDAAGKIEAKSAGAAVITVASPADATHSAGTDFVTVIVSQKGEITATPKKVTGVKVSNKKGAYVSVKWASQGKNINYRVYKKVGNGKWVGKNVAGNKTTLSVKKGAKVQVKVKSYVKNAAGKTTWGPSATKAKTFKTDKK